MVAESLRMKGELEFTRLLRVDGRFEGDLITDKGSLVVGPKGEVVGDLKNMQVSLPSYRAHYQGLDYVVPGVLLYSCPSSDYASYYTASLILLLSAAATAAL